MSVNRRSFLKNSAIITGGVGLFSTLPLTYSCKRHPGPNDTIRVALIGCRNMGWSNVQQFIRQPDVQVAMCDIDENILNSRAANLEKLAFDIEKPDYRKPELYADFRDVLDRRDIDAVIIATPDHWHALITVMACQAGKDVYVEKPMANSIHEAELMVNAGERYDTVIQVGQWQRSGPHWHDVMKFIDSGKLGNISQIDVWRYGGNEVPVKPDGPVPKGVDYNMWLGPARQRAFNPNRFHYNFRWFWDYAGGKMTDWGVHLLDMAVQAMDIHHPREVQASGGKFVYPNDAMETPDTLTVNYQFKNLQLTWKNDFSKSTNHTGLGHGLIFKGQNGQLIASRGGWDVIPNIENGGPLMKAVDHQPSTGKDLPLHVRNFLDAVKSRDRKTHCSALIGRDVARVAHMGNIAYRTAETIHWNPESQSFAESKANELLSPAYRKPWKLPSL
ncbi:MAG: Gfo/Idh/MocA family oxidoreductase [Bacteroidales bacterium]|nr:Gfo/Idh/MocA family oxidoreductase [Bacteroidales bacterium]